MKKYIKYILLLFLLLSSVFALYYITKINILRDYALISSYILVIVLFLLISFILLKKRIKPVFKIIFGILTIILVIAYSFVSVYANNTINFINNITTIKYELTHYSVMTLKENELDSIDDLKDKKLGFIKDDSHKKEVNRLLSNKIKYTSEEYDEIGSLIGHLYEKNIDALVINESYISLLEESDSTFINDYIELYSFDIKVDKKDETVSKTNLSEPFIFYISGTDSRYGVSSVARSDVNIIAVVNPKVNKILLVTTPRDYYVQLHDTYGLKDKLTHAGVYGINKSVETMQDIYSIKIDNYIKVSFSTVVNLVNAIDGIDVNSDLEFSRIAENTTERCSYTLGANHLNGICALTYARERKYYSTGDRHRGQNQQEVITAIVNKLSNPKYMIRYNSILDAINGTIETNFTYEQITEFVKYELSNMKKWDVESISVDGTGAMLPTYSMGSNLPLYVMIPDENTISIAKEKINEYLNY